MNAKVSLAHEDVNSLEQDSSCVDSHIVVEGADLLVAYIEQLGVEYVFGVPGGAIEPIYNALARSSRRGGPRPILARHEAGAAFMADGYARETGKLGVCCATAGPGATNLITGVACAYENGVPMLVLTGQPPIPAFGKRALQESSCTGVDTLGMFRYCTRYNSLISHPEQLESKLIAALMRAFSAPLGPVHLTIPVDILRSPSPVAQPSYDMRTVLLRPSMIDNDAVVVLHRMLQDAKNPIMLIGGWCGEAIGSILQYAALRGLAFVTTPDGKGLVSPRHPLFRGVFGFAGHASADAAMQDESVDLVLAIGSSMGEWTSSGWSESLLSTRLVHIDESEEHMARSPMARLHVRGRILTIFKALIDFWHADQSAAHDVVNAVTAAEAVARLPEQYADASEPGAVMSGPEKYHSDATPITPQRLMRELTARFPNTTRYLADSGNSVAWAIHYLQPDDRRVRERRFGAGRKAAPGQRETSGGWLRVTMDFAPMGWAIGGAIGTAAGCPSVPVVCITGDGSMLMNGQEISVAVAERLTVIFVVLNDHALGMVKHGQRMAGAEPIAFELPATDFAAMARAMGAQARTIHSPDDFNAIDIEAICKRKGPTLLDVHIDPEEVPPMKLRMNVLGTVL